MSTEKAETTELPQTSFEKEHNIIAGSPLTKAEVLQETPEQTKERLERDIEAGKRAPAPETIDQTKSTVTPEQVTKYSDAAYQPQNPAADDNGENGKKGHKKAASHESHGSKK
jgi:hypothetical protein